MNITTENMSEVIVLRAILAQNDMGQELGNSMIFFSHTHSDKQIIEPIAQIFANTFGQENIFYDSWSIQPGDGIIDKMTEGLSECKFFFFFVSKNSLQSSMVQLEWQNMLMRASNNTGIKFIPVKLDDCLMPIILLQTLYIDVYGKGLEYAVRQMVDVVNGRNTYSPGLQRYENVRGYVTKLSISEVNIEFKAESYAEPISRYLILLDNDESEIEFKVTNESMYNNSFTSNIQLNDGTHANAIFIGVSRSTTPTFPLKVNVKSKTNSPIQLKGLMRATSDDQFSGIPLIHV
ncbi:TPA: toll/interleukin-1 receptor domain-containing protein [Bacillus cereus]